MKFEDLAAVLLKIEVFGDMTLCHYVSSPWHVKRS